MDITPLPFVCESPGAPSAGVRLRYILSSWIGGTVDDDFTYPLKYGSSFVHSFRCRPCRLCRATLECRVAIAENDDSL